MNKILSISVAAYNVARFIPKIVEEVTACKNKDYIELIIVNDGSTDNGQTLSISQKYALEFSDIVSVIDKEDEGHGSTINTGILMATGKYFKPLDGDDWLCHDELDKLIDEMKNTESDMIVCNHQLYFEKDDSKIVKKVTLKPNEVYKLDDAMPDLKGLQYHDVYYLTKLLKNGKIRITENSFYTDSEFLVYPLNFVKNIIRFDISPYCYRIGEQGQSISINGFLKHEDEHFMIFIKLYEFYMTNKSKWGSGRIEFMEDLLAMLGDAHLIIFFYKKTSFDELKNIISFDDILKQNIGIYKKSSRKIIAIWRRSRVLMFLPLSIAMKIKNKE